jgi:hypothetical protein
VKTPVFVRFSTVVGSRGSADTVRDVRGFATKFYTQEGNYDLVGNNMPVFFIQDAIKFPDLVHSIKPEPHNEMPQASAAHDTFWDFISLMPESMHMIMWVLSDRAIPRSFSMMEGFGVHTFRFVNEQGKARFVKFHWKPVLGMHSLVWDEAQKLAGKDPDWLRRDLWESIEKGNYPEFELGVQIVEEEDEFASSTSTCSTRPRSSPKSWCRCASSARWCSTATPITSSPRPSRWPSTRATWCRASTSPTTRCCRAAVLLPGYAADPPGRAELRRDPDQPPGGEGAQQPARRLYAPDHQPRADQLLPQLAGWRRPHDRPGRRRAATCTTPRRWKGTRSARAARALTITSPGAPVLEQPDREVEKST